jgi:hypothetical protein
MPRWLTLAKRFLLPLYGSRPSVLLKKGASFGLLSLGVTLSVPLDSRKSTQAAAEPG